MSDTVDNPHDKGYKRIFKVKKNFLDFIKKYVGLEWMMDLTEEDIDVIDKEFVTDQFDTYESDVIFKVRQEKGEIYLFFLQEMQSKNDFTMPIRLLVYMTAIWLDYFKNTDENKRKRKGFRLPVIIPLVLYNGRDAWTAKTRFKEYIDCAEEFGEYVVDFKYELIDVHKLEKDFIKSTNTLIDNILYADAMMNKEDWINHICEMRKRISYLSVV